MGFNLALPEVMKKTLYLGEPMHAPNAISCSPTTWNLTTLQPPPPQEVLQTTHRSIWTASTGYVIVDGYNQAFLVLGGCPLLICLDQHTKTTINTQTKSLGYLRFTGESTSATNLILYPDSVSKYDVRHIP